MSTTTGEGSPALVHDPPEEFRGFNAALRYEFLACNLHIQQARATGDIAGEQKARRARERIAATFVTKNTRLAQQAASPLMIKDRDLSSEHLQAALLGLWEAFVGTDPTAADGVIVGDDGKLHPTGGWDPDKGTFATWSGNFISGHARRSVRRSEGAFTGMSYHTWSQKPRVDAARSALASELGCSPSLAQIAERAGVTVETVRACSKAAPASLDAGIGDGTTTLGEVISDTEAGVELLEHTDDGHAAETELVRRAATMSTVDLMVLLLRKGLVSPEPRSVVQTADKLGLGRGSIAPAMARAERILVHV